MGNFITSSYVGDFTLFELMRKPIHFPISRQSNFFTIKIPKGLPWQEAVFMLGDVFVSKIKDIPVKKGLQEADKANDFLLIDAVAIESLLRQENLAEIKGGALVYSPLYRFVTEPFVFNIHEGASAYLSNALSYILRSERVSNVIKILDDENYEIKIQEDAGKYPIMKIVIIGKAKLERVEFFGEETFSCIDLAGKKIIISNAHSPICFDALNKTGQMDLKNIRLEKSQERVEISYVG